MSDPIRVDFSDKGKGKGGSSTKEVLIPPEKAGLKIVNVDGQLYDPGMAVTPLNIEDFETDDILYVEQTMEPIIMQENAVVKTGTVILGRVQK